MTIFKAACIQMCSTRTPEHNIEIITTRIAQAAAAGAEFVALPETCNFMERGRDNMRARLLPSEHHPTLIALAALARRHKLWLLAGSIIIANAQGVAVNRSYLFDSSGAIVTHYDKIHLFDVKLPNGEHHRESATYAAGNRAVVATLPWGVLGFSICYDLRFPALYRALAQAGAHFITVPSAFTMPTGKAHWHVLLRARAIESGAYILAPAQCGHHENGRTTYGHSMIIDPWGNICAEAADDAQFIIADIKPAYCDEIRTQIPSLAHIRKFTLPK